MVVVDLIVYHLRGLAAARCPEDGVHARLEDSTKNFHTCKNTALACDKLQNVKAVFRNR